MRLLTDEDLAELDPKATETPLRLAEVLVPGYDSIPVASLRTRLRGLDADQVRALLRYEQSNANRAEVVVMLERRINRLLATGE